MREETFQNASLVAAQSKSTTPILGLFYKISSKELFEITNRIFLESGIPASRTEWIKEITIINGVVW